MKRRRFVLGSSCGVIGLLSLGCGGAASPPNGADSKATPTQSNGLFPPECPQFAGAYMATFTRVSGDCAFPAPKPQIYVLPSPDDPRCHTIDSRAKVMGDGCRYEETQSCQLPGFTLTSSASIDVPKDTNVLTGTIMQQARGTNSNESCTMVHRAVYAKANAVH